MPQLSAFIITKNEQSDIGGCLESLRGLVDEIVVVDTGSIDNTVELAKEFTDKVFADYEWKDDFADARNHALKRRRVIAEPVDEATDDDPLAGIERAELQRRVRAAIRELPERHRRVIFRADFEELPRDVIAKEFGLTENAIGQLLFRARRNLQSTLGTRA